MFASARLGRRTLLAGVAASGLARPAVGQGSRRTLRFKPITDLANIDQVSSPSHTTGNASFMVYDTLYGLDRSLTPRPQMVAGHDRSEDGLTWRFALRDGLCFHDGEKVVARDAVASIARWSQRNPLGTVLRARTEELRPVSDRDFEIRLKKPFPHMLLGLADITLFVLPERVASTTSVTTPPKDYTGSGPFVFLRDEWVSGSHAAFRRNERYVPRQDQPSFLAGGKVVNFDRVEWLTIPDAVTALGAIRKGEIDWWEQVPPDLLDEVGRTSDVTVQRTDPLGNFGQIAFNTKIPPFDNPKLRHALLYAVDQADCMRAVVGEHPELMRTGIGVFSPDSPLATPMAMDALIGLRDLDLARRMVRESGYKGERVGFMVATDQYPHNAFGTVMSHRMREVGINVEHLALDWATIVSRRNQPDTGNWHCYALNSNGLGFLTPGSHFRLIAPAPDPELVALRDAWYDAPDLAAQRHIAEQIQVRFIEAPPFLPVGEYVMLAGLRASVTDVVQSAQTVFWGARKS